MAHQNPTALNPSTRFVPFRPRSLSRSPSRSPVRKANFTAHEVDPLLGNLSPDSTLQALSVTEAVSPTGQQEQDLLSRSIAQATPAERALGIKAAIAGKKAREWHAELSRWEWPGRREAAQGKGFEHSGEKHDEEYIGSLPLRLLEHYEERIEEIRDGLEALEVEDLKSHVLSAHVQSKSISGSSHLSGEPPRLSFIQLSDFTAVITATIVQALPYLARLNTLLGTWDIRLIVLRQTLPILNGLEASQDAIRDAWNDIRGTEKAKEFNREDYQSRKAGLESRVTSLGSRFDRALDALEGREDALPEKWIDQMDKLESDFAHWVVAAEKRLFMNEWVAKYGTTKPIPEINNIEEFPKISKPTGAAQDERPSDLQDSSSVSQLLSSDIGKEENGTQRSDSQADHSTFVSSAMVSEPGQESCGVSPAIEKSLEGSQTRSSSYTQPVLPPEHPQKNGSSSASLNHKLDASESFKFPTTSLSATADDLGQRRAALQIPKPNHRREQSEISVAESMLSEAFSDLSTAEILNASTAEVSTPTIVESSPRRFSSADLLTFSNHETSVDTRPRTMFLAGEESSLWRSAMQSTPLSSDLSHKQDIDPLTQFIPGTSTSKEKQSGQESGLVTTSSTAGRPTLHRASVSSVELIPKDRVRSIVISRSSSLSTFISPADRAETPNSALMTLSGVELESPVQAGSSSNLLSGESAVEKFDDSAASPLPGYQPAIDSKPEILVTPRPSTPQIPKRSSKRLSGTIDTVVAALTPSRIAVRTPSKSSATSSPNKEISGSPTLIQTPTKKPPPSPAKSTDETIEEKIQDILTTIPARIHFTPSRKHASLLPVSHFNKQAKSHQDIGSHGSQLTSNPSTDSSSRVTTPTPSLTLTPARHVKGGRQPLSGGDSSDVKVYHLSRSGPNQPKDSPPVKLFVRLVGEHGERVMVRVGGGWADLAEYLREYALHHGRSRAGSGHDRFEVQPMPHNRTSSQGNVLTGSSPVAAGSLAHPRRNLSRPASALDFSRPSPLDTTTANAGRKARRLSAAAASIETGAESPSSLYSLTSSSSFPLTPLRGTDDDEPPPVPAIPTQHQTPKVSSSPFTGSPFTPSPTPLKYTPLGAAGPIKSSKISAKMRAASGGRSMTSSPIPPRSPVSSVPAPPSPTTKVPGSSPASANTPQGRGVQDDKWVQELIAKARSSHINSSPASSPLSGTALGSRKVSATANSPSQSDGNMTNPSKPRSKSKNRLSSFGLGSGSSDNASGGIRRVFLRRKSGPTQ